MCARYRYFAHIGLGLVYEINILGVICSWVNLGQQRYASVITVDGDSGTDTI